MKRIGGLLIALCLLLGMGAPSANAATWAPKPGTTFNTPAPWGSTAARFRIVNSVEAAINHVPAATPTAPRPVILIASYYLDQWDSAHALIAACRRGVSVRVVLDGKINSAPAKQLVAMLNGDNIDDTNGNGQRDLGENPKRGACNSDPTGPVEPLDPGAALPTLTDVTGDSFTWGPDQSYVTQCVNACFGSGGGSMHAKFFAFSQSGAAHDVTMVSSSNLNTGGATRGWNDLLTFNNRPGIFEGFKKVHREMTNDKPGFYPGPESTINDGRVTARFFPLRSDGAKSDDLTLRDLNKISCRSKYGPTQVKVAVFYWGGTRGLYLADKLISLGRAGCNVGVIYGAPSRDVRLKFVGAARRGLVRAFDSRRFRTSDGDYKVRTHTKMFMVRGTFDGHAAKLTMTGSQNWGDRSFNRDDEVTVNVFNSGLYDSYAKYWNTIRMHSIREH